MIDERVLVEALTEAEILLTDYAEEGSYDFSPKVTRRINRLIYNEKHPIVYRFKSIAAMVILSLLLGGTIVMGTSETARAAVLAWLSEVFEGTFLYRSTQDSSVDISVYSLKNIVPYGYEYLETASYRNDNEICEYYVDEEDYLLCLRVISARTGKNMQVFIDEGDDVKHVTLGRYNADFYYDKEGESHAYVWQDENGTLFYIGGHIDEETITGLADEFVNTYE